MKKIRILVLDEYLDKVRRILGRLGSVQIVKIMEEDVGPISREKILTRYTALLDRINYLIDVLKIPEDVKIERIPIEERSSDEYLREIEDTISEIDKTVMPILERLEKILQERTLLENDELVLKCLDKLGVDIKFLGISDFLYVTAGFLNLKDIEEIESLIRETSKGNYLILKESLQDRILIVLITLREHQEGIEDVLRRFNFDALKLMKGINLKDVENKLREIKEIEDRLRSDLNDIRDNRSRDILIDREIAYIEKNCQEMMLKLGKTERVYTMDGWIPAKEVDNVVREIEKASDGCVVIHVYEPRLGDNIPVSLQNPRIFKPFESIVEMFGIPSYFEIDPTPILAITFPLIFGLMFGDVGHGFLVALVGLGMIYLKKGNESYRNFGMIILYCGISAVIFGFLYGSIFGNEEILSTIWIKPSHDMARMIGITLFIGTLHMGIGLMLNAINKINEIGVNTILHSLGKLWFFFGEVTIIAYVFRFKIPFFIQIAEMYPLRDIIVYGILPSIGLMIIGELIHEFHSFKRMLGILGNVLFEIFETFSMFLSNTISYVRILILALVHAKMMEAVSEISAMEVVSGIFPLSIFILIAGNILVLVLEGLIVFIHTIRLHFYEWFTKFYGATGIRYKPFVIERKYTELAY